MRRAFLVVVCILAVFLIGLTTYGKSEAAGRGKAAPKNVLPKELMKLDIKDEFVPHAGKEAGVIQTVTGYVVVAHDNMRQGYFAAAGDRLYEKDVVFTLKQSRCRFKMHHEDVVTMGESTRVGITSFSDDKKTQEKRSAFDMAKGKAMFYTLRLFKHKGAAMEVSTPTAVAGVRGTKFGVEVIEMAGTTTGSLPVLVADLSDAGFRHLAQATQPSVQTNVHTFDGTVAVTSTTTGQTTTLGAGQSLNVGAAGLGNAFATPPSVSQQFQSDTSAGPPAGGGAGGGTPGSGAAPPASGGDTGAAGTTTTPPDTSAVVQQQTTTTTETTATAKDPYPDPGTHASGSNVGYFAGMLTNTSAQQLEEIFISTTRQAFDGRIWGRGINKTSTDYLRTDAWGNAYLKWAVFDSGTKSSGDLGTSHPFSHTTLGSNSYQEWGYWTMTDPFTVGVTSYAVDNQGYWVNGQNTTDAQMAALKTSGSATYSGNAYGTYWTSGGGANMTGTFGATVNFNTPSISGFSVDVSGGGYTAAISGASGSFSGSSSHFVIDTATGTWTINNTSAVDKAANGSVYGPEGHAIGGAFLVGCPATGKGVTGVFQGTQMD
ncbi:MAG: hypothetical protein CVU74_05620 [Deltaproteobacteria bacterium HGW-Deltaproteobacteria-9]|nr:MAG: hypothetical protein CVU74_05620 [Deltaproteobacteria bacterium HGW-Deltaproteobacteria-9]